MKKTHGHLVIFLLVSAFLAGSLAVSYAQPDPVAARFADITDVEVIRNVEYGKGGDTTLKLDIIRPKPLPKEPMPVVVFIHGGGWQGGNKESKIPNLIPLAQRGCFCASISYRLSGTAVFPAQIEDCKCAVRFLRAHAEKYNIDPARIGVWGSSAGGHLAALMGTSGDVRFLEGKGGWPEESSRVQAVCDWFGPTDFVKIVDDLKFLGLTEAQMDKTRLADPVSRLLGGPFWRLTGLCRQASPISYISKDDPPFLIMHGDQDRVVPLSQSQVFHEALTKAGVVSTLVILGRAGHGFGPNFEVDKAVAEFFDKHLRKGGTRK